MSPGRTRAHTCPTLGSEVPGFRSCWTLPGCAQCKGWALRCAGSQVLLVVLNFAFSSYLLVHISSIWVSYTHMYRFKEISDMNSMVFSLSHYVLLQKLSKKIVDLWLHSSIVYRFLPTLGNYIFPPWHFPDWGSSPLCQLWVNSCLKNPYPLQSPLLPQTSFKISSPFWERIHSYNHSTQGPLLESLPLCHKRGHQSFRGSR